MTEERSEYLDVLLDLHERALRALHKEFDAHLECTALEREIRSVHEWCGVPDSFANLKPPILLGKRRQSD